MSRYVDGVWLVRLLCQRGLAAIYLVAFVSALNQFRALLGERGLLPVPAFLSRVTFLEVPSLFHVRYSDRLFVGVATTGIVLSGLALLGFSESGSTWLSFGVWFVLYVLYLSIVNVGQAFYAFGWESMLVEAGFFACFLGPAHVEPSVVPVLLLRWMLFRVELGAGLIKIRHDACWRDLTCLFWHHETQPLPNPASWYFHRLPKRAHKLGVLFSHFVQLVAPFGLFLPSPYANVAGVLVIAHQLMLIVSGNYAWLNWLTVVLGLTALDDHLLGFVVPSTFVARLVQHAVPRSAPHDILLYLLAGATLAMSVEPTLNFFSKHQKMNFSYNPLHLVGSYGAFGSVTKIRYEIVLEGTAGSPTDPGAEWKEYPLRAKPGEPMRRPPQVAPYHLRLDWLMWFLPFAVAVGKNRIHVRSTDRWFLRLVEKLLEGDEQIARLFAANPFEGRAPRAVRARFYRYEYSTPEERKKTGAWWTRTLIDDYLPPMSLEDVSS